MEKSHTIGTQKGNLLLLLLAAVFLTSFLVNGTGSAAALRSFQSPVSPVISPSEPAEEPAPTPIPQPSASAAGSTPVLWIVIGLVVVGTFVVGLVFFQKRRG